MAPAHSAWPASMVNSGSTDLMANTSACWLSPVTARCGWKDTPASIASPPIEPHSYKTEG